MGKIRTVKPELFTHEDLHALEIETSLPIIRSFVGLFTCCDREGRFKWRHKVLKLACAPYDEIDFSRVLDALWSRGFILKYAHGTEEFGVIPTFLEHQVINNRESKSNIPVPTESSYLSIPSTREARVEHATGTHLVQDQGEGKGREGNGREMEGNSSNKSPDAPIPPEKAEKRQKRRPDDDDYKTARWMYGAMLKVNASAKQPNFDTWADDVRLMREIDKRSHRDICELFQFAKNDSFWSPNIQSPRTLREKWDVLNELRARPSGKAGQTGQKFNFAGVDRSGDQLAQAASMAKHGLTIPDGEVEL